jgi:hypothetical protein
LPSLNFFCFKTHHSHPHYIFILRRHCGNTLWVSIRIKESKVGWMDKVIGLRVNFLLAQANGHMCVDFGCTHAIDGLFWSLPIYLLGFFSTYECWVIDLIMFLYHLLFWVDTSTFLYHKFHITMKCKKQFIWLIFRWNLFDEHTNN